MVTKTTINQKDWVGRVRPTVPRIPRIEVYERMLRGTKDNGMNMRNEMSFHVVVETCGKSALRESANRTTNATLILDMTWN